jgi:hypothetical protein
MLKYSVKQSIKPEIFDLSLSVTEASALNYMKKQIKYRYLNE